MFHNILLILETNSKLFVYLKKGKSIKQHPVWHSDAILYCSLDVRTCAPKEFLTLIALIECTIYKNAILKDGFVVPA